MNLPIAPELIQKLLKKNGQIQITVSGSSMQPVLQEHDTVTIAPAVCYEAGDILMYPYKSQGLIIHRLIYADTLFYCKGDNAFKTEKLQPNTVLGKAILINNHPIEAWKKWQITHSIVIAKLFAQMQQNYAKTMQAPVYKLYSDIILRQTRSLFYITNQPHEPKMEHFFDHYIGVELSLSILRFFTHPNTLDNLLHYLCAVYHTDLETIENDVMLFLINAVSQGIISIQ